MATRNKQWLLARRPNETRSYASPQPLDAVMIGGTVGEVVESKHSSYKAGDTVVGMGGWQQYFVSNREGLMKADTRMLPPSVYLGCLGMTGVTAWYGLIKIGQPKAGQTVVVSAASGAVGSVVGQLAKIKGCRAAGIAGGKAKCDYVVKELGFDACVDYKSQSFLADLIATSITAKMNKSDTMGVVPVFSPSKSLKDFWSRAHLTVCSRCLPKSLRAI